MASTKLLIRQANPGDIQIILQFIHDLAAYEGHLSKYQVTEERLNDHLFGEHARAHVIFAQDLDEIVGFAVYYYSFSTFAGLPGLYLEDLFVKPQNRGAGVGRALLRYLTQLAREQGCYQLTWAVLHWNESAMRFYENLGATKVDDWAIYQLSGDSLERLANESV